ncbi:DHH family phosphoesterase [Adlercreutzia faecimuris]|uniref:DHH family phosphoesterase n=1 Tax=Adlercreutzia faecimuris TaxID=2897341 RepID=A0ABS9WIF2_9ACTN|nr:DHH family phosphoesterase [Adlercreutzia sp. JBNU-10]
MTVTPQTNTTLEGIAEALMGCSSVAICGHVSPDGDCLGSQLALAGALRKLGKRVFCLLAADEPVERTLAFLPGADTLMPAAGFGDYVECFVAVDVPTPERLGAADAVRRAAPLTVTVDHHAVPHAMSRLSYTDPDAAATAVLVWRLAVHLGVDRDAAIATCAYAGLMTDTGRFQYQNADAAAFAAAAEMVAAGADPGRVAREVYQNRSAASVRLEAAAIDHMELVADGAGAVSWLSLDDFAAAGAVRADAEPLIDVLRSIAGVRVACMLREQDGQVRGSLRAKDGTDVAALARELGGGGHVAAAGFTLDAPLDDAVALLRGRVAALAAAGEGA